jgi:hypothetical protein
MANVQENVILHYKTLFLQNMCRNLKPLTDVNNYIYLRKNKLFLRLPQ